LKLKIEIEVTYENHEELGHLVDVSINQLQITFNTHLNWKYRGIKEDVFGWSLTLPFIVISILEE